MRRLDEIETRILEIRTLLEGTEEVDLEALETELRTLSQEKAALEKRSQLLGAINVRSRTSAPPDDEGQEEQFRSFGDFLQAVRYTPNDKVLRTREISEQNQTRFLNMGLGASGGFVVPEQFDNNIRMVEDQAAIFRPRATVIPAGDPPDSAITVPALDQSNDRGVYAGVNVSWIAEGATKPETEPAFRELKLEPHEVAAHVVVTDKLLRNSAAVGALVSSLLRKAIVAAEEDAFLMGDGVGKPLGIIGHPATIAVDRAAPGAISWGDVVNMFARAKFGSNLCWIASQTTLPHLMGMRDAANNLIWQANAREGVPSTLLGLPILLNDQSPVLGSEGDLALVAMDYYLIKNGSGISLAMSQHQNFTQNRTVIKAFWNVDGQPWLATPMLARDGVSTVSPFVVLN